MCNQHRFSLFGKKATHVGSHFITCFAQNLCLQVITFARCLWQSRTLTKCNIHLPGRLCWYILQDCKRVLFSMLDIYSSIHNNTSISFVATNVSLCFMHDTYSSIDGIFGASSMAVNKELSSHNV